MIIVLLVLQRYQNVAINSGLPSQNTNFSRLLGFQKSLEICTSEIKQKWETLIWDGRKWEASSAKL